ncbi:hypothetical protein [Pediococcus acidilactici]|uniref:hypothetical protein n=1 Tax=Pediococcus acidilactici TaxID=1254 RepID=UPI00137BD086|nr:hypothetical protein [Pediococcus acidilactici]QHS03711.1 hypothetical protein GWA24_08125 [Pediococcus acidilactici]
MRVFFRTVHDIKKIDIGEIDIYFSFGNIVVESKCDEEHGIKEIEIRGSLDFDPIYSNLDVGRLIRPELLIVQGIISLFIDFPVTVDDITHQIQSFTENFIENESPKCTFKIEEDYSNELELVLERIEDSKNKKLAVSILDRWRKVLHFRNGDMFEKLYRDEELLGIFHILDLLSDIYVNEWKKEAKDEIKNGLKEYGTFIFKKGKDLDKYVNDKTKIVEQSLGANTPDFSTKIKYLLSKEGISSEEEFDFVGTAIKCRNAIAHGRVTFQPVVNWPLAPFFNISESFIDIDILRCLTRKLIGNYFGINVWDNVYNEFSIKYLRPSVKNICGFIENPSRYKIITIDDVDILNENKYVITWESIYIRYLQNQKKINIDKLGSALKSNFFNLEVNSKNAYNIFTVSVILTESNDLEIVDKCRENIEYLLEKELIENNDLYEIIPELDLYHINYTKYKEIITDKIRKNNTYFNLKNSI